MALRNTFQELIEMTRKESRSSTNTSRGIDHLDYIKQVIVRNYVMLAESYDWEHLRLRRGHAYKTLAATQRYYDFPTNLNAQKIEEAWYLWGAQWHKLVYQITNANYNALNSDLAQVADPVTHWDYYANDALDQFEVWPIPASDGATLHFIGQKKVAPLVDSSDRADLDGYLIALVSAAEMLSDRDQKSADKKTAIANTRLGMLKANVADKRRMAVGMNDPKSGPQMRVPRQILYVR
jgi:hypothetical protein